MNFHEFVAAMERGKMRNFQVDFVFPAIKGLEPEQAQRVAKALDAAICFGVLEHANGNDSLRDLQMVEAKYNSNVAELKK